MFRVSQTILNILVAGFLFVTVESGRAQTCGPVPGSVGCDATACSSANLPCVPSVVRLDAATGAAVAVECACADSTGCQISVSGGAITCSGVCDPANPAGGCQLFSQDTNNDGADDQFWCDCAPDPLEGVCCLDIDDGPIAFDTCIDATESNCLNQGGMIHPVPHGCSSVEACCLPGLGSAAPLCQVMSPFCCEASGGKPLGAGTTCTDPNGLSACPQACGGFAGIQCSAGEFCQFNSGECCCDFIGVCTPIPSGCPDIWDPVCGCDGTTYGNACEAQAAGQSIQHPGSCPSDCSPSSDGFSCTSGGCSDVPEEMCIPTALHLDIATGAITVESCDCQDFNVCHIEFGNASPFAVGHCPGGAVCEAVGEDTDGDGIDDLFTAQCAPLGACCADAGGTPLPLPVCGETTQQSCSSPYAFFEGPGTTCDGTAQACCLPNSANLCVDVGPACCEGFGGISLGVGTACGDLTTTNSCPRVCGGIAGIPCNTGEFCNFPNGHCGDGDQTGLCETIPTGCPDVWDPVCGCDGTTYGNECEAAAVGISIRHDGECTIGACCLNDAAGTIGCVLTTPFDCALKGGTHQGPGTECFVNGTDVCGAPTGACCLNDPTTIAHCIVGTAGACANLGGTYQGDATTCPADPNVACGVPCPADCPSVSSCFAGCGELVPGPGCLLFQTGNGETFSLDTTGGFNVGDRVFVSGCRSDNCTTTCQQGVGCLHHNTIRACERHPYGLNPDSSYQVGCFPPCLCPLMQEQPMGGTMTLTHVGSDLWYDHYAVTNVEFIVHGVTPTGTTGTIITGSGRYKIGGDFALTHQLTLDVQIDGQPVQHLDSGMVPGGASFPRIEIQLSENGLFCFDTVLNIDASRLGACCLANSAGNASCVITTELTCAAENGLFQGEGTTCPFDGTVPCIEPTGACCLSIPGAAACVEISRDECFDKGGIYQGNGTTCPADPSLPCPSVCGGFAGIPCDDPAEFCKYPPGTCDWADHFGECTPIPQGCPDVWDPVCGCDGVTYGNECEADAVGAQIDHPGVCACEPAPNGLSCNNSGCNSAIPEVACKPRALVRDPVTNSFVVARCECFDFNECHIELGPNGPFPAGFCPNGGECQIIHGDGNADGVPDELTAACEQPCGGIAGLTCDPNSFCLYPPGTCHISDRMGVCRPLHGNCPTVYDPVCGCDGVTYGNECEAHAAGQSVDHPGECEPTCCPPSDVPTCFEGVSCCADGTWECNDAAGNSTCPAPGVVCPQICGGIAGTPCGDPNSFCKFAPGTCHIADNQGMCTPVPNACFDVWDPVCGCDGVTYGNECEADAAQASIDHPGECEIVCGGFAGQSCGAGEFCKFPEGICSDAADHTGICTDIPGACPEIYDPVCGCDQQTYSNECFADAASVSVLHRGPCPGDACAASRILLRPQLSYCPTVPKVVVIALTPPAGANAVAVEDAPPAGWTVGSISNGGTYDAANHKVKWGPFFPPFPSQLTYEVIPASGASGPGCFSGTVSVEGVNEPICGDDCIDSFCRPLMQADMPQPDCPTCPLGDCTTCNHGACRNGRISLCEVISYACAWKVGCNDDLAGVARAAYIWKNGECYCWDEALQNWYPNSCPSPDSGYCPASGSGQSAIPQSVPTSVTADAEVRISRLRRTGITEEIKVPIAIAAPTGTSVYALEVTVPAGWKLTRVTQGGEWDETNRKIKWGPFYDEQSRTVVFTAVREVAKQVRGGIRDADKAAAVAGFSGAVSFDGMNTAIEIR